MPKTGMEKCGTLHGEKSLTSAWRTNTRDSDPVSARTMRRKYELYKDIVATFAANFWNVLSCSRPLVANLNLECAARDGNKEEERGPRIRSVRRRGAGGNTNGPMAAPTSSLMCASRFHCRITYCPWCASLHSILSTMSTFVGPFSGQMRSAASARGSLSRELF